MDTPPELDGREKPKNSGIDLTLYFILGAFCSACISIVFGFTWLRARSFAVTEFVFYSAISIVAAVAILTVTLIFRAFFLRLFFRTTRASLEDVAEKSVVAITSAATGEKQKAISAATDLSRTFASWYSWVSFYRWVVSTIIGFFIAITGFAGVMLLLDQNERLEEANQIEFINFRERFRRTFIETAVENSHNVFLLADSQSMRSRADLKTHRDKCDITISDAVSFRGRPNTSSITAATLAGTTPALRSSVQKTLNILLTDDDETVRLGAFFTLAAMNAPLPHEIVFKNVSFEGITISPKTPVKVIFADSIVEDFSCEGCYLKFDSSYARQVFADSIESRNSIIKMNLSDPLQTGSDDASKSWYSTIDSFQSLISISYSPITSKSILIPSGDRRILTALENVRGVVYFPRNRSFDFLRSRTPNEEAMPQSTLETQSDLAQALEDLAEVEFPPFDPDQESSRVYKEPRVYYLDTNVGVTKTDRLETDLLKKPTPPPLMNERHREPGPENNGTITRIKTPHPFEKSFSIEGGKMVGLLEKCPQGPALYNVSGVCILTGLFDCSGVGHPERIVPYSVREMLFSDFRGNGGVIDMTE